MLKFVRKSAIAAIAAGTVIMLSGCEVKNPFAEKKPDFNKTYTVSADIKCGRLNAKADVTRAASEDWQFVFTEPKQLNGVTLCYGADGLSASLGGLSFSADENSEYAMLPEIIGKSIDLLAANPPESVAKEDASIIADSAFNGEKVTVTVDEKTGDLQLLKCPHYQLSVTFSGQKPYVPKLPEEGGLLSSEGDSN